MRRMEAQANPVLVELTRGETVESVHRGAVAICDARGDLKLALGVDNLFDKTYAEHLNLAGNSGFGYPGGVRINEPGRTLWLRADVKF